MGIDGLTMDELLEKHFDAVIGGAIYPCDPSPCAICRQMQELRCGVCFTCRERLRISEDLTECWDIQNPKNRWPFQYRAGSIESALGV